MFDAVTELLCIDDVVERNLVDPFFVYPLVLERNSECDCRQDCELVRRVGAVNIERRISFGVAEALSFFQNFLEISAAFPHRAQNVVARAVDNARKPLDAVARKRFRAAL